MKHNFRIVIGMLLFTIPLCLNAQVKPVKSDNKGDKPKTEKPMVKPERPEVRPEKPEVRPEKPGMRPDGPMRPEGPKPGMSEPKGGFEMPKISGFVQGMYQANLDESGKLMDGDKSSTFRMRRVRMSIDGTLAKGLTYKIQGDFTRKPMLVDAFVKYKACNEFAIQVGQFKTPFTIESPINPVNLEIFDYGESVQKLGGYSDVCGVGSLGRDLGIMATGSLFPIEKQNGEKFGLVDYSLGVFNGNGANEKDNNNRKDIVGRLDIHPGMKALTLSGSYYYGNYYKDAKNNGVRNRWAAGMQYNDGDLIVRAEYLSGTTGSLLDIVGPDGQVTGTTEILTGSKGYYAVAGYNFKVGKDRNQKLMPVLRYEHFAEVAALGGTDWYTMGINYWPIKSLNFKLDYSLNMNGDDINSHRVVGMVSYKF